MAYRYRMLVEGKTEQHVIRNLLRHYSIPAQIIQRTGKLQKVGDAIAIEETDGIDLLLADLEAQLLQTDQECLGVVLDADQDLAARWTAVKSRMAAAADTDVSPLHLPDLPDPAGTIVEVPQPDRILRVGVWIMPDNQVRGMLEDFLALLRPNDDVLLPHAEETVANLPDRRFSDHHLAKAVLHTWLAWQESPGVPLGIAITAKFFDIEAPDAAHFVAWVRRLFQP